MRVLLAVVLASVVPTSAPAARPQATRIESPVIFDAKGDIARFYGVPMDLTLTGLKRLPYRFKFVHSSATGTYKYYTIKAPDGVEVEVSFENGKLDSANTSSRGATGPNGIGVGSLLSDVKKAWPEGHFNYGFEEHQTFVYFDTNPGFMTGVTYYFEPKDMPAQAFDMDYRKSRDITVPDIRVKTISISVARFQEENYDFLAVTTGPCVPKAGIPIGPKQRAACQRMTPKRRYRGTMYAGGGTYLFAPVGQPSCAGAKDQPNCAELVGDMWFRPQYELECPTLYRVELIGRRNVLPGADPAYRINVDEVLAYWQLDDPPNAAGRCVKRLPRFK